MCGDIYRAVGSTSARCTPPHQLCVQGRDDRFRKNVSRQRSVCPMILITNLLTADASQCSPRTQCSCCRCLLYKSRRQGANTLVLYSPLRSPARCISSFAFCYNSCSKVGPSQVNSNPHQHVCPQGSFRPLFAKLLGCLAHHVCCFLPCVDDSCPLRTTR